MGHWISFGITLALMLLVGTFLFRTAAYGHRSGLLRWRRWGPLAVFCFAVPLILADLVRHVLQDTGVWPECGNNVRYSRVNTTDPFPASCLLSSSQYKCSTHCCVPTWDALPSGDFGWTSAQSSFFPAKLEHGFATPQFATLTANGSLFFPVGFNRSEMPYTVFTAPVALDATGTAALPHGTPDACDNGGLGTNPATGFCLLPADAMPGGLCDCDSCQPHEDFAHLSPIGIAFTIVSTYAGFGLLALAVLWNADVTAKMRGVATRWRELRARRPPTAPEQTDDYSSA